MSKTSIKLIIAGVSLVLALAIAVVSTYAWFIFSGSPEINGMKISIGGSNTIMIAPDITRVIDDVTYHYPGEFAYKVDFSRQIGYEYLASIVGLSPYSTADGINWYTAAYHNSAELFSDNKMGELKELEDFKLDNTLKMANMTELPSDGSAMGCYVYVDYWIVSPTDCNIRVSANDPKDGSYVMQLYCPEKQDDTYALKATDNMISACARVGFLVNEQVLSDEVYAKYAKSTYYSSSYKKLCGDYQTKGQTNSFSTSFTIYEPNADRHSVSDSYIYSSESSITSAGYINGSYAITKPLGLVNGTVKPVDISDILAVQKSGIWDTAQNGEKMIEQIFKTFIAGKELSGEDSDSLFEAFYSGYLQHQYSSYITCGDFISDTGTIYENADGNGCVDQTVFRNLAVFGAAKSTVITSLQRNVPQKIRMYIWLEGQDVDCVNSVADSNFAVNIQLAGGNS